MDAVKLIYDTLGNWSGSPVQDCDCGITNYAGDDNLMDPGEFEGLEKKLQAFPSRYHRHHDGFDTVSWCVMPMLGRRVSGCRCGWEQKLVDFLLHMAGPMKSFYTIVLNEEREYLRVLQAAERGTLLGAMIDGLQSVCRSLEAARNNDGLTAGQWNNFKKALRILGDQCPAELRHHINEDTDGLPKAQSPAP